MEAAQDPLKGTYPGGMELTCHSGERSQSSPKPEGVTLYPPVSGDIEGVKFATLGGR